MDPNIEAELVGLYEEFCSFGAGHKLDGVLLMDSRTCQKLARDCGVIDRRLTRADVDLVFVKVKARGSHRIDFNEFVECTRQWAEKKGISHEELLEILLSTPGPTLNHVTEPDHSKFTDSPSVLADEFVQVLDLTDNARDESSPSRRVTASTTTMHPDWYAVPNPNPLGPGEETYYVNKITKETTWDFPAIAQQAHHHRVVPSPSTGGGGGGRGMTPSPYKSRNNTSEVATTTRSDGSPYKSVFDKLTDPTLYTGTHKLRFDPSTGRGRGRAGRDSPAKSAKGSFGVYSGVTPKGEFKGNTNTGTDQVITDISEILTRR